MDTTTSSSKRQSSLATSAFAHLFKRRPSARRIQKRNTLPANASDQEPASSPAIDPVVAVDKRDRSHRQSWASHSEAEAPDPNFRTLTSKHQRSQSVSTAVLRSRYEDSLLRPIRASGTYVMGSTMAPAQSYGNDYFTMQDPSNKGPVDRRAFAAFPEEMHQRPTKLPPAMRGNYAQIDMRPAYNSRRSSSSASSVASSVRTNDTFDAILTSPASSRSSFDSWNSSPRRPEHGWQRPAPIKQYRRRRGTGELLAALPEEVLGLILDELRQLHLKPGSTSCATCMMRDLCSVALSSHGLLKAARVALYENIQLVGADSQVQKKRYKLNFGSRIVLLRRTLRANPEIAALVHSLKAPAVPQGVAVDLYQNLVASVIMACPNFERLVGFYQNHDYSFNRLFHALSTRHNKEMHWTLEASQFQRTHRTSNGAGRLKSEKPTHPEAPGDLLPEQSDEFLELHVDWEHLETLSIHCLPGATITPISLIPDIVSRLPALKSLHLSHLPFTAFSDANLLSLPSLETLTLSHLPGVTSEGLSSFVRRPSSWSIRKLTLQHVDVGTLPALSQILSNLPKLETFTLVQSSAPVMPSTETIWLFPYLAAPSLRKLHWDITGSQSGANTADEILARSIETNGFPSLCTLRAPNDPEGTFQALCKPAESIETANDKFRGLIDRCTSRPSPPATPTTPKSLGKAPSWGLSFPNSDQLFPSKASSNLAQARRAAQGRLEAARKGPGRFNVKVIDDDGTVTKDYHIGSFIGTVESKIRYCLTPDEGATDENGGLVDIADVLGDNGENLRVDGREGCTGKWNTYAGNVVDKKDRERWWHTERGRWNPVTLS